MTDSLTEAIYRARAAQRRLVSATEALNLALTHVEGALVDLHLGVRARVELDPEPGMPGGGDQRSLRFEKRAGTWGLFIGTRTSNPVPLLQASREARVAAATAIPRLFDVLVAGVETEAHAIETLVSATLDTTNRIRGSVPPDTEEAP